MNVIAPDLENDIQKAVRKAKDIEPHYVGKENSFTDIVEKLQSDDLDHQSELYQRLLDLETESMAEQMTHRAMLMRQRADEFDEIAAGLRAHKDRLIKSSKDFCASKAHVLELIHRHAFIQPTKVNNNG